MSNQIELIRAEIERRWKELADKNVKAGGGKYDAEISTYLSVLAFLDTLPEQPVEGLEGEIERFCEDMWGSLPNFNYSDGKAVITVVEKAARHFAEWGAEHLKR